MVPTGQLLAFSLTAFALIVVPGPSVLFVIGRSIALGRRAGLATVVGNAAGAYTQVIAVAVGVGALVERSSFLFGVVKLAGAAYLIALGVRAFIHRHALVSEPAPVASRPRTARRSAREGFVVGVTNPKVIVFFSAVLPQFVDPAAGQATLQLLVLGLVFVAIALVSDGAWAMLAGTAHDWLARSARRTALLGGVGGFVMIGLGIRLALTRRTD
ncbi:MAG: LysE family translocator [Acidimicrobiales bacterium]